MAHGDAGEGKWRGNWLMEWVSSTLTPPPNVVYPALLKLMSTSRLPAVDWTDTPTDLTGLVRLRERRNLVSARVPSRSARAILHSNRPTIGQWCSNHVPRNAAIVTLQHQRVLTLPGLHAARGVQKCLYIRLKCTDKSLSICKKVRSLPHPTHKVSSLRIYGLLWKDSGSVF